MNVNLDIAVANSRGQKVWHNEQWTWEKIVKKIKVTHRTAETYSTYISLPKPRQAEIKDIGGFVGGYLINGTRGKGFVKYRQILALDIDNGYPDLWDDFTMYYPNAALVYSTHAHSLVSPRLRLVLPLDRPVSVEEYEAIGRKIAGVIGTVHFDRTTFQAERLMYWPSTAKDGDFFFRQQDGPWLSADQVLSEYRDWTNVSEWPLCPTESEIIKSDLRKQEDPTEKEGIIGAFCRAYTISDAITEFLPHVYAPAGGDRFTYLQGTTAAGAVCYDDKFLFSHHSTDPTSGILCNAFDLVRIHKFGSEDNDPTAPIGKRPSFGLMSNLARKDASVIREIGIFNLDLPQDADTSWLQQMDVDKRGNYTATINNFLLVLRNDTNLKGKFSLNELDYLLYVKEGDGLREFDDSDEGSIRHYFETTYGIYHAAKAKDAFTLACKDNSFHPVRDYLNSLEWDGTERLERLFIDHLGVADNPYTRAVTRKSLVAAVARVMQPGIKFDYMVVTVGSQGKGKSSLLADLGKQWFSDTLDSVAGKEAYMQIQGAWIMEMAELSSIKKADVEAVKHFLTKREDRYRPPFGRHNVNVKRQTVFFASTNEHVFLIDKTGNRRFWPLVVTKKYTPGTIDPDPLWAEALWYYKQGEPLYLTEELEALAAEQQSAHTEVDERAAMIKEYLDMLVPPNWYTLNNYERISYIGAYHDSPAPEGGIKREQICAAEVWCELFRQNFSDMTAYNTKFIHNALMSMPGWERTGHINYTRYGSQRSFVRQGRTALDELTDLFTEEAWENA